MTEDSAYSPSVRWVCFNCSMMGISFNKNLEHACVPQEQDIIEAVKRAAYA